MSVVTVLHQSQPCPLSRDVPGAPSALTGIITALQTRFEQVSANRYIDVTHAVPAKSNFSSLPTSPVATPNRPTIEASMGDYFSVPKTTVYSRATVAASHAESQEVQAKHPGTKSFVPQTVVAPSSIDVSVFQRFIPPPTKKELEDLFKSDRPSALVDRLSELKPDHGKLVFVYPTRDGALTFRGDYLGPVLDPHMRTMVEVLGISRDAAADIAYLAPVYEMHDFHGLRVKVSQLLAGMNRMAGGNLHRFSIVSASQETVYIGREAWAEWFIEQEQPRIREIMNASYGRKPGRPLTGGGGDYTAAGLVREIFDAIKDRAYEPGQAPREGIEVGVFVIKRTQ